METDQDILIRPATPQDIPSINAILTYYALHSVLTFATTAQPDSALAAKLESITSEHSLPFYVAIPDSRDQSPETNPQVVGICYISPYRPERLAYSHTGELSLFVHHEYHGRGTGSALLRQVLKIARETTIREVLAVMAVDQDGKGEGLALRDYYRRWGFREVGTLEKVGFKFGKW